MVYVYVISLFAGIIFFGLSSKLFFWRRVMISILIFVVPSLLATFLLIKQGDKALPGSRTVTIEELAKEGK